MIPIRDNKFSRDIPYVTYTLVALNALIYLWDRGGAINGPSQAFADLAMNPREVVLALQGHGDWLDLAKMFTAMFLHGNLIHLLGNLIFLAAFGPNVEAAMGSPRYALYYVFWGVAAFSAQVFVSPFSEIAVLGASGAIGGVLGAYFLLFPGNKIKVIIPPFFWWTFDVFAFILLGLWFLAQFVFPQDGVATWAHAGGFVAGMFTVLASGGAKRLLVNASFEQDEEFEDA